MIGESTGNEGELHEPDNDKRRVGENSRTSSQPDISTIPRNGSQDGNQSNTTIRTDRLQDSGFSESNTGTLREQSNSSGESQRAGSVDNNSTQQKQQTVTDITRIDVEWSIFLLQRWYNSNLELADAITHGLPELRTNNNINMGLAGLPDIRAIQQDALRKLQQKAESDATITKPIMPTREPIHPFLRKLISKIRVDDDDYDVDILTTSDIQYLITIINKFATLQLTVAQSIRTLQTKVKVLPKPKQNKTEQISVKPKTISTDEELEKELNSISHEEIHD